MEWGELAPVDGPGENKDGGDAEEEGTVPGLDRGGGGAGGNGSKARLAEEIFPNGAATQVRRNEEGEFP